MTELAKLADLETRVPDLRPVDLEELADEAVEVVASTYPERRITVEFPRTLANSRCMGVTRTCCWQSKHATSSQMLRSIRIRGLTLRYARQKTRDG